MQTEVMEMIQAKKCRVQLDEITLKPGVLAETDYFDTN